MRRILAEEEVLKKGFWRRQFDSVPTGGQELFDGIFGVILPVLCFAADPIVFKGGFFDDRAFLDHYRVLAYLTSAVEIAVFIVWRTFRKHLTTFSAPFAGVLFAGGIFSTAIGIVILPLTLFGLLLLIGILGFIPFLTGFVYFRSGVRAMKDQVRNSTFGFRFLTAALTGVLVIAMSVCGSVFLEPLIPRAERPNRPFDETWDGD
jgi:hypothetical protein